MRLPRDTTEDGRKLPFLCECGDVGCDRCVPLTTSQYEALPRSEDGLALAPGHRLERRRSSRDGDGG